MDLIEERLPDWLCGSSLSFTRSQVRPWHDGFGLQHDGFESGRSYVEVRTENGIVARGSTARAALDALPAAIVDDETGQRFDLTTGKVVTPAADYEPPPGGPEGGAR